MMVRQQQERELEILLIAAYMEDSKQRNKGEALSGHAQRIMELFVLLFGKEMQFFAGSLSKGIYDAQDCVQDALTEIMSKAKWQAYNPNRAGDTGVSGWFRTVYRNSIRDAHKKYMRYASRHVPLDEGENYA